MPSTVEEVFDDYRGRRAALITALTTGDSMILDPSRLDSMPRFLFSSRLGF